MIHVRRKNVLVLPKEVCQELRILSGDMFHLSVEDGQIILRRGPQTFTAKERKDLQVVQQEKRKVRILKFVSVSEAFDESDFDH